MVEMTNPAEALKWTEMRPWGSFLNLVSDPDYKVKLIEVGPRKRLSYQSHAQRSEHWFVVKGKAEVTLEDKVFTLSAGESIRIPVRSRHRLANSSDTVLQVVEVQMGSYFGEDDITRYEDDFGRAGTIQ
jgi:mannose-6-phosphate isomerase-like protein (cupin superfamily)